MLYKFLESYRDEILELTEKKTVKLAGPLPSSVELRRGLPIFFENLIRYLKSPVEPSDEANIVAGAAGHGLELMRLNYTLSHVVHAYGAMCQAITEFAQRKSAVISTHEFNELNMCLDIAIASAVSEFQFQSVQASEEREVQHMGFLVHELRNALSSATVAQDMIRQGLVGTRGSTARVLEANLSRMRSLIDRSLSEVRMRADPHVHVETFYLNALVDQILLTARSEAKKNGQTLKSENIVDIELSTDRQLLLAAIANLLQNAMKYSKRDGQIEICAVSSGANVVIEIEDECGGVDVASIKNLFKPFVSGTFDQSGLGLGLTIVQRAVSLLQGKISHKNQPGHGCRFLIKIPKILVPVSLSKAVAGHESTQPKSERAKKD